MRARLLVAATVVAAVIPAGPAFAGDPTMPLGQVQAGMRCTGYSVVRGTDIAAFDVEVLDVVDGDPGGDGARSLVRVSGPAVDGTGIAQGFSGSPVYCADGDGTQRNIGAISESVGEYGDKVVLVTPIEAMLGNPVDAPRPRTAARSAAERRRDAALLARAKPLATPLTVSGLSAPLGRALERAGRRAGRAVLAAPAGPLGSFPRQTLRPGSAVSVGYSSGDLSLGAVGTVTYTDGDRVWAFGHPFEGVGARSLLLQDAYVFHVVNNPDATEGGSYKLAAAGHDLGSLTNDALSAVVGRTGALPRTIPVRVHTTDDDTGQERHLAVDVADETSVDNPTGLSPLAGIAPLAILQASSSVMRATPARVSGRMCLRIALKELPRPLRLCNRYVASSALDPESDLGGNPVGQLAAMDVSSALALIDEYEGRPPRVTGVEAKLDLQRGEASAVLRDFAAPRRVRPGQRVPLRVRLLRRGGGMLTRTYTVRIPRDAKPGRRSLVLIGPDRGAGTESGGSLLDVLLGDLLGTTGSRHAPATPQELAGEILALQTFDGVTLRMGDALAPAFRDRDLVVSGRVKTRVRVARR